MGLNLDYLLCANINATKIICVQHLAGH